MFSTFSTQVFANKIVGKLHCNESTAAGLENGKSKRFIPETFEANITASSITITEQQGLTATYKADNNTLLTIYSDAVYLSMLDRVLIIKWRNNSFIFYHYRGASLARGNSYAMFVSEGKCEKKQISSNKVHYVY
jgi:hypothetical protein